MQTINLQRVYYVNFFKTLSFAEHLSLKHFEGCRQQAEGAEFQD